ncbi:MAG: hypothetical protein IKR76_08430 [Ruminococcus sp.]|nr:hypothetical protein [Ruminococcus sp.]
MITQITSIDSLIPKMRHDHYSRRIRSHYQAYGGEYDFCRFFLIKNDEKELGIIALFNSSMLASTLEDCTLSGDEIAELIMFIAMNKPLSCELEKAYISALLEGLPEYKTDKRTQFRYKPRGDSPKLDVDDVPSLNDVYKILASSFPAIANSYELWLTDMSHRVRRGLAQSFLLGDYTTATIQYIIDRVVLVGHVATVPEERGKLHARKLLYWIGERLSKDGFEVILFARPHRVSYYNEIGFEPIGVDLVLERKNDIDE